MPSNRDPIHVVAAVIVVNDKYLICRRAPEKQSGGKWEFPGGKVETAEDASAALKRELLEELDVSIEPGSRLIRSQTTVGTSIIDLELFWATLNSPPPETSTDHDQLKWVSREQLAGFDWCTPDIDAVEFLTRNNSDPRALPSPG